MFSRCKTFLCHYTSRLVQVTETEFPTITICMDPPLKPSVMSKYGFKSLEEVVINDVPNVTLIEKLEVLSYMLNLDFSMKITRYNQDNKDVDLKLGENEFFFVEPVITFLQGFCYKLATKFQVNNERVIFVDFHIQLKSGETNRDQPSHFVVYLTSPTATLNIAADI